MNGLTILTGPSGSGKTTWCRELIRQAECNEIVTAGVVSPAAFTATEAGEKKTGIDAVLLPERDRFHLARIRRKEETTCCAEELGWVFDEGALTEVERHLASLYGRLKRNRDRRAILVLDELGPLELVQDKGWTSGAELLDRACYSEAVVIIRPSLLDVALERWGGNGRTTVIDVSQIDDVSASVHDFLNS